MQLTNIIGIRRCKIVLCQIASNHKRSLFMMDCFPLGEKSQI